MEPVFSNRIIIDKNENIICKLRTNERTKYVNFLLKKIYTFFSEKPKEEKVNTFKKFKNKLEGASHHIDDCVIQKCK